MVPPPALSFATLVDFMEAAKAAKNVKKRREVLEKFILRCIEKNSGEAFEVFRLVLPQLDFERPTYNLKAPQLIEVLLRTAAVTRNSAEAKQAKAWKVPSKDFKAGGSNFAGDFSKSMKQLIFDKYYRTVPDKSKQEKEVKIREVSLQLPAPGRAWRNRLPPRPHQQGTTACNGFSCHLALPCQPCAALPALRCRASTALPCQHCAALPALRSPASPAVPGPCR